MYSEPFSNRQLKHSHAPQARHTVADDNYMNGSLFSHFLPSSIHCEAKAKTLFLPLDESLHDRNVRRWSLSPRVCVRWPRLYMTSTRHRRALSDSESSQPSWRPGRIFHSLR